MGKKERKGENKREEKDVWWREGEDDERTNE